MSDKQDPASVVPHRNSYWSTEPDKTTPKVPAADRQIYGLDFVRFIAACLVMMYHYCFWIYSEGITPSYSFLKSFFWFGSTGVEIFFVLSGFIITYSAQKATFSSFVKNRFIRLYPTAWICATVTLIAFLLWDRGYFGTKVYGVWINSMLLRPTWSLIDQSYWTLPVELGFYIIVAVLLYVGRFRYFSGVMMMAGSISTAFWFYKGAVLLGRIPPSRPVEAFLLFLRLHMFVGYMLQVDYGCLFATGVLLWLCLFQRPTALRLVALLFCILGDIVELESRVSGTIASEKVPYPLIVPTVLFLLSIVTIFACVRYNAGIGVRLGPSGMAISRRLGLITYPLYLIHQRIGYIAIGHLHMWMPDLLALVITVAGATATAFVIHQYGELPVQHFLRDRLPGSRKPLRVQATTLP